MTKHIQPPMNKKVSQEKEFECKCIGGQRSCGKLLVINLGGLIEFNWVKYKRKTASNGIVLDEKDIKKLLKFLPTKRK